MCLNVPMKVKGLNFETMDNIPLGIALEEINEEQINQIISRLNLEKENISKKPFITTIGADVLASLISQNDVKLFSKHDENIQEMILLYSPSLKLALVTLVDK